MIVPIKFYGDVTIDILIEARIIDDNPLKEHEDSIAKIQEIETLRLDLKQKSRCKWLTDDDKNSSFFHGIINSNLKGSRINGLMINGTRVTNLNLIKNEILVIFKKKFKEPIHNRLVFHNNKFSRLFYDHKDFLFHQFSIKKDKVVV